MDFEFYVNKKAANIHFFLWNSFFLSLKKSRINLILYKI